MLAALIIKKFKHLDSGAKMPAVESVGILQKAAGQTAAPEWTYLQRKTQIDLSNHTSRYIGDVDNVSQFDVVVCTDQNIMHEITKFGIPAEKIIVANDPEGMKKPPARGVEAYYALYNQTNNLIRNGLVEKILLTA